MILSKTDVRFDGELAVAPARNVHPHLTVLPLSACSGEGMPAWYARLKIPPADAALRGQCDQPGAVGLEG